MFVSGPQIAEPTRVAEPPPCAKIVKVITSCQIYYQMLLASGSVWTPDSGALFQTEHEANDMARSTAIHKCHLGLQAY